METQWIVIPAFLAVLATVTGSAPRFQAPSVNSTITFEENGLELEPCKTEIACVRPAERLVAPIIGIAVFASTLLRIDCLFASKLMDVTDGSVTFTSDSL